MSGESHSACTAAGRRPARRRARRPVHVAKGGVAPPVAVLHPRWTRECAPLPRLRRHLDRANAALGGAETPAARGRVLARMGPGDARRSARAMVRSTRTMGRRRPPGRGRGLLSCVVAGGQSGAGGRAHRCAERPRHQSAPAVLLESQGPDLRRCAGPSVRSGETGAGSERDGFRAIRPGWPATGHTLRQPRLSRPTGGLLRGQRGRVGSWRPGPVRA